MSTSLLHLAVACRPPRCAWSWRRVEPDGSFSDGTGHDAGASAYRLRLHALVRGLETFEDGAAVEVVTTDRKTIDLVEQWLPRWEADGFRKKRLDSPELIRNLAQQVRRLDVSLRHQPRRTGDMHAKDCSAHAKSEAARMPADAVAVCSAVTVRNDVDVVAWTDGGSRKNPGPSGWGAVIVHLATGATLQMRGGTAEATNNRMELLAIAEALDAFTRRCRIEVRTDSRFSISVCETWRHGWKRRGWKKADGDPPANLDVVLRLDPLLDRHDVVFTWVRGHTGEPGNELADAHCNTAIDAVLAGTEAAWSDRGSTPPFEIHRSDVASD